MKRKINKALLRLHPDRVDRIPFDTQIKTYARNFTNNNLEIARFRLSMISNLTPNLLNYLCTLNLETPIDDRRTSSLLTLITREGGFKSILRTQIALQQILKNIQKLKSKKIKYIDIT